MRTFLILIGLAVPPAAIAQLFTCNGVDITVENGAQLTIKGDALAGVNGSITNTGTIDLSGDLTNNSGLGLFASVPGSVIMNGTAQVIGGSDRTNFDDLTLYCATLDLQQDMAVGGTYAVPSGTLALNDAMVHLNSNRLLVNNGLSSAITRNNGQIVSETDPILGYGDVQWLIRSNGGLYNVPFGDGLNYLPVLLNITAAATTSGSFHFATYPTDPFATPNNRPLPTGLSALTDLAGIENAPNVLDRFWIISTEEYPMDPVATLTFTYRDGEWNTGTNTIVESALQAQRFDGVHWSNPPIGVVNTTNNTVTTAPINVFDMVWALVATATPLPVELLSFNAWPEGAHVLCSWSTASEQNNDFFAIERSRDGDHFEEIGQVDGAGNSQQTLHYTFTDGTPYPGLSYYRLRQTDLDGTEHGSQVVPVWFDPEEKASLMAWPNPCNNIIHLTGLDAPVSITVMDATGRVVIPGARTSGTIDVSTLASGGYSLVVLQGDVQRSVRFVKQ